MVQTTAAPPAPPGVEPPRSGSRRRRWPLVVSLVLVLAIVGGISWVGAFAATYRPLADGDISFVQSKYAHDLGSFTSPQGDLFDFYGVECHVGIPVDFGFSLTNTGPIGVTILRLIDPTPGFILTLTNPRMGPGPGLGLDEAITHGPRVPFRPFYLAPHQFRVVVMSVVMHSCENEGVMSIASTQVTFRVLGITRHRELFFPYRLGFSRSGTLSG